MGHLLLIVTIISVTAMATSTEQIRDNRLYNAYNEETTPGREKLTVRRNEHSADEEVFLKREDIRKQEKHHKEQSGRPLLHLPQIENDQLMNQQDNLIDSLEKEIENDMIERPEIDKLEIIHTPENILYNTEGQDGITTATVTVDFARILKNISSKVLPVNNKDFYQEETSNHTVVNATSPFGTRMKHFLRTNPFLSGFFISIDIILLLLILFIIRYGVQYSKKFFSSSRKPQSMETASKTSKAKTGYLLPSNVVFTAGPVTRLTFKKSAEKSVGEESSTEDIASRKSGSQARVLDQPVRNQSMTSQKAKRASGSRSFEKAERQPLIDQDSNQSVTKKRKEKRLSIFQSVIRALSFGKKSSEDVMEAGDGELEDIVSDTPKGHKTAARDEDAELLRHMVASNLDFHIKKGSKENLETLRRKTLTTGERHIDQMIINDNFRRSSYRLHKLETAGGKPSSSMLHYNVGYKDALDFSRIKRAKSFGTIHSDSSDSF